MEDFIKQAEAIQAAIWQNKLDKGFNTTNVPLEFSLLYGEVAEAFDDWRKKKGDLSGELADVAIYLFALAAMNKINLGEAIVAKMDKNKKREYQEVDGTLIKTS